jgi:hypothetical protein
MKEASRASRLQRARTRVVTIRFAILVAAVGFAIVTVMIAAPLVHRRIPLMIVITLPLLVGVYVVTGNIRYTVGAALAFAVTAALTQLAVTRQENALLLFDLALRSAVVAVVIAWAAQEVLREEEVSLDTILGGICIYLLVGYFFAHVFLWLLVSNPAAVAESGRQLQLVKQGPHPLESIPSVVYFSFTTLTTIGFGDFTPVSGGARLAAMIEGIVGQLFPAIFIARLVSLYVARGGGRRGKD